MTLRHLEIFKTVCEQMSITKAADELNMTQPAVSIAIKELENFYNTKLFDRLGRRIYLTETGNKLQNYANTIIEQFNASVLDIHHKLNHVSCRMGVNVTVGEGHLASIIKRLKKEIPELGLYVTVDNTESIEKKLENNEIDFAIMDAPSDSKNLTIRKLYSEQMAAVCSPQFQISSSLDVKELEAQPLLLREKGSGCRKCIDEVFEKQGCFIQPIVHSVSNLTLIELAKHGMGIAILPISIVKEHILNESLKELELGGIEMKRDYYIIKHKSKCISEAVMRCILKAGDPLNEKDYPKICIP